MSIRQKYADAIMRQEEIMKKAKENEIPYVRTGSNVMAALKVLPLVRFGELPMQVIMAIFRYMYITFTYTLSIPKLKKGSNYKRYHVKFLAILPFQFQDNSL